MIDILEITGEGLETPWDHRRFTGTKRVKIKLEGQQVASFRGSFHEVQSFSEYVTANAAFVRNILRMTEGRASFQKDSLPRRGRTIKSGTIFMHHNKGQVSFVEGDIEEHPVLCQVLRRYNKNLDKWISACRAEGLLQALFQFVSFDTITPHFAQVRHNSHTFEFFVIDGTPMVIEIFKDGRTCDLLDPDLEGALAKTLLFKDMGAF